MYRYARKHDLSKPAKYLEMETLLNTAQFSDYILVNWFSGTGDWGQGNWYGGIRIHPPGAGLYFCWDAEMSYGLYKRKREIHVILDNLSAHKTAKVAQFLEANPKVRLHFTPTYSSWLNKIELWFSKIERALIHRGVFTSTHDLTRKIMRYIRKYNEDRKPNTVKWTYNDPSRRIKTTKRSVVTVH